MDEATDGKPIVFDPEILPLLRSPAPTMTDFERRCSRSVATSYSADPETLEELIDALEGLRDELGGETPVNDDETGARVHVHGTKYEDGETVLRI